MARVCYRVSNRMMINRLILEVMVTALNWDLSSSLGSPIRWHTEYRTDTLAPHLWRGISRSICAGFWCTLVCYYYIRSSQCIHFVCSSVAMAASVNPGQSHDNDKFTLKYGWNDLFLTKPSTSRGQIMCTSFVLNDSDQFAWQWVRLAMVSSSLCLFCTIFPCDMYYFLSNFLLVFLCHCHCHRRHQQLHRHHQIYQIYHYTLPKDILLVVFRYYVFLLTAHHSTTEHSYIITMTS